MSRTPAVLGLITLALAATLPRAHAQQQAPLTRTEVVQLDVVVTDAEGRSVRGLTQADFEVLEDKKPQRITNFLVVDRRARAQADDPAAPEAAAPEAASGAVAEARPGRHLVIVIDDLHIAPGNLDPLKGALRRLVGEFLGPDDSVAVVTTGAPAGARQLSQEKAEILQQIMLLNFTQPGSPPAASSQMTPAQAELILRGDRTARRLVGRMIIDQPGSVYADATSPRAATEAGQAAIATATAAGQGGASSEQLEAIAEKEAERQARAVLNDALRYSVSTLHAIEDVLRSLAPLPGRKLCLLVSDGFLVGTGTSEERTRDLRAIVDAATRSGAVVYAVDSRGLQTTSISDAAVAGSAAPTGLAASVDRQTVQLFRTTLETLAEDTGGFLVTGTNAFDEGLKRVLADSDAYYLMAYEPTNRKRDGRFRKIEVRLPKHARHVVRTRAGYLAPDDSRPARGAGVRQASASPEPRGIGEPEARAIIAAARTESGLPLRLSAEFVDLPPGGSQAIVRANADVSGLDEGDANFAVDFLGGVYDASGEAVGPAFGLHAPVPAGEAARARREGVGFSQRLALPPGRYEIRLAARDSSHAHLGGASQWVEIPDLKSGQLALSGVFLSTSTPKPGASAETGAAQDLRDVQAVRRFKSRDNLFFQVYVYNLREEGGADAVLQAQLRQGETLVAASQPQPIKPERKDGVLLPQTNGMPLDGLTRGSYQLRVVVMDKKANVTVHRQVDFTVE